MRPRPNPRTTFVAIRAAALALTIGGALMSTEQETLAGPPKFEALLCKRVENRRPIEPTTKFQKDSPGVYGYWKSGKLAPDAVLRFIWTAIDVGAAAPPNTRIGETKWAAAGDPDVNRGTWADGSFQMTKPTAGWPVGRYKVDIYLGDVLIKSLPFAVE